MLKLILLIFGGLFVIGLAMYAVAFVLGLIFLILKVVWEVFKFLLKVSLALIIIGTAIYFYQVSIPLAILYGLYRWRKRAKEKRLYKRWLAEDIPVITESDIDEHLVVEVDALRAIDTNSSDYAFDCYKMPYGRVSAFLGYFRKSLETDEPYYYSALPSNIDNEMREYGTLITNQGIYLSRQYFVESESKYFSKDIEIPYNCLVSGQIQEDGLKLNYIDPETLTIKSVSLPSRYSTIKKEQLYAFIKRVIDLKLPQALYQKKIIAQHQIADQDEQFQRNQTNKQLNTIVETAGVMGASTSIHGQYNELKYNMNGSRGHGYGAEYGNNTFDKLHLKDVVNAGQVLDESGRQIKHGADRVVDGVNIQTKYYKTAPESVGAAFQNKDAVYLNENGTMMQIEVPRDQYHEALQLMQKRIDSGQVPNVQPGEKASNYVKKGVFTYSQAHNICKAGTIESLSVDLLNGSISCSVAGGVSAAIVFAIAIWQGKDAKEAGLLSLKTGVRVIGKGALIYTVSMQLSRDQFANPLVKEFTKDGQLIGFAGVNNPIYHAGEHVAELVRGSSLSTTPLGEALGLSNINGRVVISTGVTAAVVFGPDLLRALSGRISTQQLFKNSVVGASGIGGSMIGQALIPIPIVGAMIGGMAAGFIAKAVMDEFIEDDAKAMFQILKEEFLDIVMLSNLDEDEFEAVTALTLSHKKLPNMLRDMYASQSHRDFARSAIVSEAVATVISDRPVVKEDLWLEGYVSVLEAVG